MGLEKVVAAGHHTGACIATALAARHPHRVSSVILHGCPMYTEDEARAFRTHEEWNRAPRRDGGHMSFLFSDPEVEPLMSDEALSTWTWMAVAMFLQGPDIGHWAVNRYDMAADLKTVAVPGLVITDLADPIQYMNERALGLRPEFERAVLSTTGLHALMTDPDRWAGLAEDFLRRRVW
jgi:pimeloyl-ACP methyl ester carboxylesterase